MKEQNSSSKKNTSIIDVNDILEVLSQNNFSNQKQVELIQVLNYVLHKKQYPHDLCGIMDKKIQLLQQPPGKENSEDNKTKRTQKVTTDVLMLFLHKSGIRPTSDDKTKMARLISYLTDFSEEKIRQRLSNADELTSYHREEVDTINKILTGLNFEKSIKYNKQR
ncbi:hypothetical protein LJC68_03390 [Bacteroidales bacterium OttesenSCG-928-B11]|nr:hypothetical protein [Bacteroidales bacterium OttesenSCG-928-E04]MDL2311904.1 hypothetical protein [Bacteroidales bacterium OttesenSCG-928-B11]